MREWVSDRACDVAVGDKFADFELGYQTPHGELERRSGECKRKIEAVEALAKICRDLYARLGQQRIARNSRSSAWLAAHEVAFDDCASVRNQS